MDKRIKILWLLTIIMFLFLSAIDIDSQIFVFFNKTRSFASDFFNVCRYICDRDPYNNELDGFQEKIYPPIAYLLMYPYTMLFDYHNQTFISCANNLECLLSFISFTLISVILWCYSSIKLLIKYNEKEYIFPLLFGMISSVFLYTIERGNFILLSAALCNLFIAYYNSSSSKKKGLALFCLALSSALKVYPVILAILLLRNKDFKSFVRFCVITSVIVFLPFVFFAGGFDNIPLLIRNVSLQSSIYGVILSEYKVGIISIYTIISNLLSIDLYSIAEFFNVFISLISLTLALFVRNEKISILLLIMVIALFPKQAWVYNIIYIIPIVFVVLSEMKYSKQLFILLLLILQPIQIVFDGHSLSYIISNIACLILWWYFLLFSFCNGIQRFSINKRLTR